MNIRAKFTVTSVTDYGGYKVVNLEPRYDDRIPEDARFYSATSTGKMEMTINNPAAADQFQPGRAFYADFTPVD